MILESYVFGCQPKWAFNGLVVVVAFGITLIDFFTFANIVTKSEDDQNGSPSMTAILRFIAQNNLSTIQVAQWSPTGARISLIF